MPPLIVEENKKMLIKGERIDYINIHNLVDGVFGEAEHAKRVESLSNAALGVISGASLIIHRIGMSLAQAKGLMEKHAIKQVDRLLSNNKLRVWECFSSWVPFVIGARKEIMVAMDWTEFDSDGQSTIAISLITRHGRATPLLWKTVYKSKLKNKRNEYEDELLCRLHELVPSDVKVTVLADRGFGDTKLFEFLKNELGFHFAIRIRGNIHVTDSKGEKRKAEEWVSSNGRARTLRNATVTANNYEVGTVVCKKAAGMKEPWCIVSSDTDTPGNLLIQWYSKRWGIEPQFRDTKDIHFGMGLSSTKISSASRRDRLLLISALAVVILTFLGAAGENLGMDRLLKANTVKRRTLSLFRQGYYYYQRLPRMASDKIKELLEEFTTLIDQQRSFVELLGVV